MSDLPLSATYVSVEVSSDEEGGDMELAEDVWGRENREEAREENREEVREEGREEGREEAGEEGVEEGGDETDASQEVLEEASEEVIDVDGAVANGEVAGVIDEERGVVVEDVENGEAMEGEARGVKRKKTTSAIWGTAAMKQGDTAVCLVCKSVFKLTQGNTTGIRSHVKTQHPSSKEYKKFLEEEAEQKAKKEKKNSKKPKLTMYAFVSSKKPLSQFDSERMTEAVGDYLVQTNTSLNMVENPAFRKLLFKFNSGWIAPSRKTVTDRIDKKIKASEEALKKELIEDIKETKTVSVTTDGGPSHDKNKTKKNAVTVTRIDSKWRMKTDTLTLEVAEGSQTGEVIRTVVRDGLRKFGIADSKVNITTDGASAPRSARNPARHLGVGLSVKYDTDCIDHQIHLLIEESTVFLPHLQNALARGHDFVMFLSIHSVQRRELLQIQKDQGVKTPLCPMMGTKNRWAILY